MARALFAVAGCLAALGLVACGGGGGGSKDPQAKQFTSLGCASCHTLAAAGSKGSTGPNLDTLRPTAAQVDLQVTNGGGAMPSFKKKLTKAQILALSVWVADHAGKG